jgi:hypothetical protein
VQGPEFKPQYYATKKKYIPKQNLSPSAQLQLGLVIQLTAKGQRTLPAKVPVLKNRYVYMLNKCFVGPKGGGQTIIKLRYLKFLNFRQIW